MKGRYNMNNSEMILSSDVNVWEITNVDFWKITNANTSVIIEWSHDYFCDYKTLAYQFYKCGYEILKEVIRSGHDNVKSDMWFMPGIVLVRHSLELGLKALLCRTSKNIQKDFKKCKHDISKLIEKCNDCEEFLNNRRKSVVDEIYSFLNRSR